jgi:aminoglycoside phosphotransferase (APT) family kinase protein
MALDQTAMAARLQVWLSKRMDKWRHVTVKPINVKVGAGYSAEISFVEIGYQVDGACQALTAVVRRQPQNFEVVLGSSLALQGQMMHALSAHGDIPVPAPIGMELDASVLEMPFLLMAKVDGQPASMRPNYNREGWLADMSAPQRFQTWRNGIEAFAKLTRIRWKDGFEFLARAEWGAPGIDQYIGQITAWHQGCRQGRAMPYVDAALNYVHAHKPKSATVDVLWGDPTPSNILFSPDGRVNALIDWELAALGPAELDLAWWLFFDDMLSRQFGIERLSGLPTRAETIEIWESATGRKAQNLDYYDLIAALRMALVAVGSFDRQVNMGLLSPNNKSLNDNMMTLYLAQKLKMPPPELGPDHHAFMSNLA